MTYTYTSPRAHLESTGAQSEFMTQPGLGPKPPASGSCIVLPAQPLWTPWACLPAWCRILPRAARPVGVARPSFTCCKLALDMFGTSTDLNFFYAVASPQPPSYLGVIPLHSRTCDCSPLFLSIPSGGKGFPAPPLQEKEGFALGAGTWLWATAAPERPASLSQCSHPVKSIKSGACWHSAQGVLKGFHILF